VPQWWEELFDERYTRFYEGMRRPVPSDEEAAFIESALALPPGAEILDLGCGQGRHSVALALRGHAVTGLDLSEHLLGRARELARDRGVKVSWVRRDMRQTEGLGPFDACLSLFTSFGFFDDEEDARVLRNVHSVLKPDGCLLLDIDNPFVVLRRLPMDIWTESDEQVSRSRMVYDFLQSRRDTTRTSFPLTGGRHEIPSSSVRLYFPHEIDTLLRRCGFRMAGLYGSMGDEPFTWHSSPRMIFLADRIRR
jgi:SAM-dependent methyltransferase